MYVYIYTHNIYSTILCFNIWHINTSNTYIPKFKTTPKQCAKFRISPRLRMDRFWGSDAAWVVKCGALGKLPPFTGKTDFWSKGMERLFSGWTKSSSPFFSAWRQMNDYSKWDLALAHGMCCGCANLAAWSGSIKPFFGRLITFEGKTGRWRGGGELCHSISLFFVWSTHGVMVSLLHFIYSTL